MIKQELHIIKGMQKDLSVSKAPKEYAFDAHNIRITAREDSTTLSITNERGNKELLFNNNSSLIPNKITCTSAGLSLQQSSYSDIIVRVEYVDAESKIPGYYLETIPKGTTFYSLSLRYKIVTGIFVKSDYKDSKYIYYTDYEDNIKYKDSKTIPGTYLGHAVLNNNLIVFSHSDDYDFIHRFIIDDNNVDWSILYKGKLNFSEDNPIETIVSYETEEIQKVYWIDGVNQCRMINIVAPESVKGTWIDTSFDFIRTLALNESIDIERLDNSNGMFASGNIQYMFSYYDKYGQESNIFYTSPLNYISFSDRGASPEDKVSCSFKIRIYNPDKNFDYLRIYSIHRSSINTTPYALKVADISIDRFKESYEYIEYIDNGTEGEVVDATALLTIGGYDVTFKTFTHKDNTLFLGNAKLNDEIINQNLRNLLRNNQDIYFTTKFLDKNEDHYPKGYYSYKNSLNLGSKIKTFKYDEWYRFGLQFQNKKGRWSEPVFIKDAQNHIFPDVVISDNKEESSVVLSKAYTTLTKETIQHFIALGFEKVRGVIVHPSISDRKILAQGILCPTVYNVGDRFNNAPFAQSSWFCRPQLAFDIGLQSNTYNDFLDNTIISENSPGAIINNENDIFGIVNKGTRLEFRHNRPIPNNWEYNAEIQSIANVPSDLPYTTKDGASLIDYVNTHQEYFYVDQSIVTFHSPDIEFDNSLQSIDLSNVKMRIVGEVKFTSNASDIDIQTATTKLNPSALGFYKEFIGVKNISYHGHRSMSSGFFFVDDKDNTSSDVAEIEYTEQYAFRVYPWHRNGSLNNHPPIGMTKAEVIRPDNLKHKKMSNIKYSAFTKYHTPWYAEVKGSTTHTGITNVQIWNSEEQTILKIKEPANSNLGDLLYYGNVDKIVMPSISDEEYTASVWGTFNKKKGYPIATSSVEFTTENTSMHSLFVSTPRLINKENTTIYGIDPVSMKYKSTPHAVFALNYTNDGRQVILPTTRCEIDGELYKANDGNVAKIFDSNRHFFWNTKAKEITSDPEIANDGVYQDIIPEYISTEKTINIYNDNYSYLYMAELYIDEEDSSINRFGGNTEDAFENNAWIPAGEPVRLYDYKSNGEYYIKESIDVEYTEGDTYYQRYDCLKTYPYTLEDTNSIVDIVSFMCETRVNLDGRYDRNRGQLSNLVMTPSIFNKLNDSYNQKNNFFVYRGLNLSKFRLRYFPNTITWTREKKSGAIIDAWHNITMLNTIDLDGDKGEITSLNRFNDEMYCFQNSGLSNILFNSRIQVSPSDGVPIELATSSKVGGKHYINELIGCNNKWSIAESINGIYFIDSSSRSIYLYNGKLQSLTDSNGLSTWLKEYPYTESWRPLEFNNFITFYDRNNRDVYFINKDTCLCYSELLGQFTSFMSYENVPAMFNIKNNMYSIKDNKLWKQFEGDYNIFYDEYKPYDITFISNSESTYDKIYDNIEFRSDSWNNNKLIDFDTFDYLEVWNEYQRGECKLTFNKHIPSSLKKKFRVWRANIPRDNSNNRDRIRNTWAYIKLSKKTPNTFKTEFHDLVVKYFI